MQGSNEKEQNKISQSRKREFLIWIFMLTLLAGALNAYAIKILGNPATHHTGNSTLLAISICEGFSSSAKFFFLLLCFFLGSTLSGMIFHEPSFKAQKRYGILLILGGASLGLADMLFSNIMKLFFISFWVGMQNAMFIRYDGILVRTGHMTGYLTDAGLAFGAYLRGYKTELLRTKFYLCSVSCFIIGGILGYINAKAFPFSMSVTGFMYALCGVYYFLLRKRII